MFDDFSMVCKSVKRDLVYKQNRPRNRSNKEQKGISFLFDDSAFVDGSVLIDQVCVCVPVSCVCLCVCVCVCVCVYV